MRNLRAIQPLEQAILERGRIDTPELDALRDFVAAETAAGPVDRGTIDFLVELGKRVERKPRAFAAFVDQLVKQHLLGLARIEAKDVEWLGELLLRDGVLHDEGRRLLREVHGEAKNVGPEFERFFAKCMRMTPEPHTSG